MQWVNRSALNVRVRQSFVDWLNQLEATEGDDDLTLSEVCDEGSTYLIDELDISIDLASLLKPYYLAILTTELSAWEEDKSLWPYPLNWDLFEKFLQVDLSLSVTDLSLHQPLLKQSIEEKEVFEIS